jgi:hypothetical protein
MNGRDEESYKILENPRGRGHLSDLGLVGRVILK